MFLFLVLFATLVEELNVAALFEGDNRLLPIGAFEVLTTHALDLSALNERVDALDLDVEELLHSLLDLDLVCLELDLEDDRVVLFLQERGFLGEGDRAFDDLFRSHAFFSSLVLEPLPRQRASMALMASLLTAR